MGADPIAMAVHSYLQGAPIDAFVVKNGKQEATTTKNTQQEEQPT